MKRKDWTAKDVLFLQILAQDVISLNKIIGSPEGDQDVELGEIIIDEGPGPEEIVIEKDKRDVVLKVIRTLPQREQMIILMRYGFITGNYMTLEEIGKKFKVTRERIRQIESDARKTLKRKLKKEGYL